MLHPSNLACAAAGHRHCNQHAPCFAAAATHAPLAATCLPCTAGTRSHKQRLPRLAEQSSWRQQRPSCSVQRQQRGGQRPVDRDGMTQLLQGCVYRSLWCVH